MEHLSLSAKALIKAHVRRMFCVGLVVIAGMIDLAQSEHDRKKVFGEHEGSLEKKNDGRESGGIRAESNAGADKKEKRRMIREVSAYNSVPAQTDSSPCISADGTDICKRHKKGECIVASNAYPLNTRLRIENIGDCIVADRTNPRFRHRIDLFMDKDIRGAKNFGVQKLTIAELDDDDDV